MKRKLKILKFLKIIIFLFIVFFICNLTLYLYAFITPKFDLQSNSDIIMYDKDNMPLLNYFPGNKKVKLEDISKHAINATIATEDKNFYKHKGFDYFRILKALYLNIKNKRIVQGASTISQQYIKNMYLTFEQTWKRKIEEAFLTLELETHYNKNEILEGYLNKINYGSGNYGIENASNYYFNKKAKDLTLAEASMLVGIPKNPTLYNPINNFKSAKNRQLIVLDSMLKNKYISKDEYKKAKKTKLNFVGQREDDLNININYYKDAVLNELNNIKSISKSLIKSGGLKVYTNLDIDLQNKSNDIIKEEMDLSSQLQVASLIIEPKTGKIKALIGGKNYSKSEFNRVTSAYRQVGSTIKPILYYSALENGFTSSSTFTSERTTFNMSNGKTYSPQNYGDRYPNKPISLATAIAYSDNIYAVKTNMFLGTQNMVDTAKKMGINNNLQSTPSLALGTATLTMLDFSNAYNTLANYGIKIKPYFINKIEDYNGNILYEKKHNEELVLNKNVVFILNELLTNTYDYNYIDYSTPTMLPVSKILSKKYAVKSGTTNTDFWVVGYNPDILVLVWNGYDNNKYVRPSESIISKRIWAKTIEYATQGKNSWYEIPNNITASFADPISGQLKINRKKDLLFYIKGTEPYFNNN